MTELENVRWRRFASGLHQPLGLVVADGQDLRAGPRSDHAAARSERRRRSRLLRVLLEQDAHVAGRARFHLRPGARRAGPLLHRVGQAGADSHSRPTGKQVEVLATGFRNPDGLGLLPDGAVTVPCCEGEWTPASMICLVKPRDVPPGGKSPHFGYQGPKDGQPPSLPLVYLPRGLDNCSGGQAVVDDRGGPLAGQIIHLSFGAGKPFSGAARRSRRSAARGGRAAAGRVPLGRASRQGQSARRPALCQRHGGLGNLHAGRRLLPARALHGAARCSCRSRFTCMRTACSFRSSSRSIARRWRTRPNHFAQVWNYRYSPGYGSPELAPSHPGVVGHEALAIAGVHVLDERHAVCRAARPAAGESVASACCKSMRAGRRSCSSRSTSSMQPFTQFPGYHAEPKTIAAHPQAVDLALLGKTVPNPWGKRGRPMVDGDARNRSRQEPDVRHADASGQGGRARAAHVQQSRRRAAQLGAGEAGFALDASATWRTS